MGTNISRGKAESTVGSQGVCTEQSLQRQVVKKQAKPRQAHVPIAARLQSRLITLTLSPSGRVLTSTARHQLQSARLVDAHCCDSDFGLWRVRFPPCLVRPGRRLPVQGLSDTVIFLSPGHLMLIAVFCSVPEANGATRYNSDQEQLRLDRPSCGPAAVHQ